MKAIGSILFVCCLAASQASARRHPNRPEEINAKLEARLETVYKPCFYHGSNCPPGVGNFESMEHELPFMRQGLEHSGIPVPSDCDCDDEKEQCVRRCYYAVTKAMVMQSAVYEEKDDGGQDGEDGGQDGGEGGGDDGGEVGGEEGGELEESNE